MRSHRTTARGFLLLALLASLAAAATAPADAAKRPKALAKIIFPVVGPASYSDDFGDSRGTHSHQGNDIMAPRRAPAVAAEDGKVKFHTTSALAGCMLYLYGASGTTYLYIHLNNDLTKRNDNRGRCVAGTAYWKGLKDGGEVKAGEPIAYVGDSGDADGNPHLHFEVHPDGGGAVNPYPYLQAAQRLLFVAPFGSTVTLSMTGVVMATPAGQLRLKIDTLRVLPGTTTLTNLVRPVVVTVPPDALVQRMLPTGFAGGTTTLAAAKKGQPVSVLTQPVANSLDVELARDGILSAAQVLLRG